MSGEGHCTTEKRRRRSREVFKVPARRGGLAEQTQHCGDRSKQRLMDTSAPTGNGYQSETMSLRVSGMSDDRKSQGTRSYVHGEDSTAQGFDMRNFCRNVAADRTLASRCHGYRRNQKGDLNDDHSGSGFASNMPSNRTSGRPIDIACTHDRFECLNINDDDDEYTSHWSNTTTSDTLKLSDRCRETSNGHESINLVNDEVTLTSRDCPRYSDLRLTTGHLPDRSCIDRHSSDPNHRASNCSPDTVKCPDTVARDCEHSKMVKQSYNKGDRIYKTLPTSCHDSKKTHDIGGESLATIGSLDPQLDQSNPSPGLDVNSSGASTPSIPGDRDYQCHAHVDTGNIPRSMTDKWHDDVENKDVEELKARQTSKKPGRFDCLLKLRTVNEEEDDGKASPCDKALLAYDFPSTFKEKDLKNAFPSTPSCVLWIDDTRAYVQFRRKDQVEKAMESRIVPLRKLDEKMTVDFTERRQRWLELVPHKKTTQKQEDQVRPVTTGAVVYELVTHALNQHSSSMNVHSKMTEERRRIANMRSAQRQHRTAYRDSRRLTNQMNDDWFGSD